MKPIRIAAVSYYNTLPFIYGLRHSGLLNGYELQLAVPSQCAALLKAGQVEMALSPVGAIPELAGYKQVTRFGIAADKRVDTVCLYSQGPIGEVDTIFLDTDSRTSVNLTRILAEKHWHIAPRWQKLSDGQAGLGPGEAYVLIGDKTIGLSGRYNLCLDLASEWNRFTQLPFVFAAWMAAPDVPAEFLADFEQALSWGVQHRKESISLAATGGVSREWLIRYLDKSIRFELDDPKVKGMELFLSWLKENPSNLF